MEEIISIPEFNIELQFRGTKIVCFDQITKQILDSEELRNPFKRVRQEDYNKFLLVDIEGERYNLEIKLITEVCCLETNAEYIRDLFLDSPNHGYYFGTYEIGEFSLRQDRTLKLNRSYALRYCIRGLVTSNENIFLSLRESETIHGLDSYFLVKLSWPKNSDPVILWKKPVSSAIRVMLLIENHLLLGFKDGTIQQWDTKSDEHLETFSLFQTPITLVMEGKEQIFIASWNGELAAISKNGSVLWKTKPSEHSIHGLIEDEKGIHLIDQTGIYFLLDAETGIMQRKEDCKVNASIYSNLVGLRGWLVLNDGNGIQAIHWGYKKRFFQLISDLYIRQFQSLPIGILTGDDGGIIRLWLIGQLKLLSGDPWRRGAIRKGV